MSTPLETFLISDYTPYRLDGLDRTISPVYPKLEFYELAQPHPKWRDTTVYMPTEIQERILDHLVVEYLKLKHFGPAASLCRYSFSYMKRMYRQWIVDAPYCIWTGMPSPCVRTHFMCFARKIHKFFYLGMVLFDYAFDTSDGILDDSDDQQPLPAFHRDYDLPVVTINHPYGFSRAGEIKPHHLVANLKKPGRRIYELTTLFDIIPYPSIQFAEFNNPPTVSWVGNRFCDCFIMDATCNNGIYEARKVVYPFLIIRIDTEEGIGSDEWKTVQEHWRRFATMVKLAFEGAELYIANNKAVCQRV